ncbi:MAG: FAD-binding protein [Candidatus Aramenus sp.]|nr:FAD-binding protein [Candidatus Aramenus sp.]
MIRVSSEEELFKEIRSAHLEGRKVSIIGFGSHSHKDKENAISTQGMDHFEVKDDYVVALAGAPVPKIREEASEKGLLFPSLYDGSVGGMLALNHVSPISFHYGTPKEFTVWCRAITFLGGINWKIFIGSKGKLGAISKAVMRLYQKPRRIVTLEKSYSSARDLLEDFKKGVEDRPIAVLVEYDKEFKLHMTYSNDVEYPGFSKDDGVPVVEEGDKNSYVVRTEGLKEFVELVEKTSPIYAYTVPGTGMSKVYVADEEALKGFEYYPSDSVSEVYLKLKKLLDYKSIFE